MNRIKCSICLSNLTHIYSLQNVPVKLVCVNNIENNLETLSFSQCNKCKTIQLDKLIPLNILYSESHNYTSVGKVWEKYYNKFSESINEIINNKNILEIGDPSGKIANKLHNYNKWFIVEPNINTNVLLHSKIKFIKGFFDENFTTDEHIDVIIHSHVFEHIYDHNLFLKKCYNILNENGQMFFGVPNMEHITNNNLSPFLGVFFEHTVFLNKSNITYLLESNGFHVINIIDYELHSTMYHIKKNTYVKLENFKITNYYNIFFETLKIYNQFISEVNMHIKYTNLPVYIFGASYNTQYLLALGLMQSKISGILDNSNEKHNKYLYGYNIKIYSPLLLKNTNAIVILKNGYYVNEIREQLYNINSNTIIIL